jgi:hypothetical protein
MRSRPLKKGSSPKQKYFKKPYREQKARKKFFRKKREIDSTAVLTKTGKEAFQAGAEIRQSQRSQRQFHI